MLISVAKKQVDAITDEKHNGQLPEVKRNSFTNELASNNSKSESGNSDKVAVKDSEKAVLKIVIFYEDNTFREFRPQ